MPRNDSIEDHKWTTHLLFSMLRNDANGVFLGRNRHEKWRALLSFAVAGLVLLLTVFFPEPAGFQRKAMCVILSAALAVLLESLGGWLVMRFPWGQAGGALAVFLLLLTILCN